MPITTPGALLIKHMLPTDKAKQNFDLYRPIDKGGMKDLINNLLKNGGDTSHEVINELGKLFFNKATEIGATTPLSDYHNESDERQALFSEFEHRVAEVLKQRLPKLEQARQLDKISGELRGRMEKSNLQYMLSRGSTAAKMARTGARGNAQQLSQGTASPMMAADVKGVPIPVAIKHSFAEGLSAAEHLAMSYGGRASTVMSQLSTEKPGALFKKLTPAVFHEVVTEQDCGTKNGIPMKIEDKYALIGRYEAGTNKLIDEVYYKDLKSSGKKTVIARSSMTCHAKEGICQKCYGLAANGKLPDIGFNAGVVASQSVSEVLTQAMLSTKHQGGVAGRQRNPYEEANNLLSNPENFQDEATIAEINGTVNGIHQTSLKDWEVTVGDKTHFIPNFQEPVVKKGDIVRVGDPLSTGTINPEKLVALKGAGAGRVYLGQKMREIYSKNADIDVRHFDLIARNMIKHVQIVDPGESGFLPGDKVEIGKLEDYLKNHSSNVKVDEAQGRTLSNRTLDLTPGTYLTANHIDDLKKQGIKEVPVSESGLIVKPIVPGLQSLKFLDKNWISKLSFNRLHHTIQEAAALGQKSPIHSTEPVASYIIGNEFGEGEKGRY